MKIIRRLCHFILPVFFLISCKHDQKLTEIIELPHYPSASGIDYFNKKFYIIGDDATRLLVLDSNLTLQDSILLFEYPSKRIPKEIKPDVESAALLRQDEHNVLLFLPGSGSAPPRNKGWFIHTKTWQADTVHLDTIFQRLKFNALDEINIEGACSLPGTILLANRGHKAWPKNHLVFLRNDFWKNQMQTPITTVRLGVNTDTSVFNGLSGLAYSRRSDKLIVTVSTENTYSSYDDGAIGKSYLWIVDHISSKRGWKGINPNKIIDLEKVDHRFKNHKIESACIEKEDSQFMHLVLVSDNDRGSSTLFRMILKK